MIKTSGILSWNLENLKGVPSSPGVYILRDSPVNGSVVALDSTSNLNEHLFRLLSEGVSANVNFFEWYVTEDEKEATRLKEDLKSKYNIE